MKRISFLVVVMLLLATPVVNAALYQGQWTKISKSDWEMLSNKSAQFATSDQFLAQMDQYVKRVSNFLDINLESSFQVIFAVRQNQFFDYQLLKEKPNTIFETRSSSRIVRLNLMKFQTRREAIVRKLTYVITPGTVSPSLRVGLGALLQDEFGANIAAPNYGAEIMPLAKEIINLAQPNTIEAVGSKIYWQRSYYYILSHSFSKYLIEKYGLDKFMKLYQAEQLNVAYQSLYNKDLTTLKNEWRKHLQEQPSWAYNYQEWLNKKLTGLNK